MTAILSFFGSVFGSLYTRLIAGAILLAVLAYGGYSLYSIINEAAENRIKLQVLSREIKFKDDLLVKKQNDILLRDDVIKQRDASLKELEEAYNDITEGLGDDADQPAPKSLQELMRRLNKK